MSSDFEKIYLNQSKAYGRMRIADSGLGWKAAANGSGGSAAKSQPFLLPSDEVSTAHWSRGARGYELRVQTKNQGVVMLDGFDQDDFNELKSTLQRLFDVQLEHKEHSLRGWNWGQTDLARNELIFQVNNRPSFEIPYSEISNSNLTGRHEVAVEMNLTQNEQLQRAGDELVEVRFYVPGTIAKDEDKNDDDASVKKETGEEGEDGEAENTESNELNAATFFYEQLKDKADIGQIAGDAVVSFSDILFLTPRGRYDVDMYRNSLRLRGKTYDYKIQYRQIERIFSLPKPDDTHHLIILQIDPPLRQGNTRYPFLVLQFFKEEETEFELNITNEDFESTYKDRLKKKYDTSTHLAMSHVFKGLSERRVIVPGSFMSRYLQPGISCSTKASEGYLYPLDKCFLFVTKPTIYIPMTEIANITMSRTGTSTTSRTFDLEINLRGSLGSHNFSNIEKEEQASLENYCKEKGIRVKNDENITKQLLAEAMNDEDDDEDDEDVVMGSADEEESVDEDFDGDSDSDVAEEFDSDVSGTDSEAEGSAKEEEAPPKKKSKK